MTEDFETKQTAETAPEAETAEETAMTDAPAETPAEETEAPEQEAEKSVAVASIKFRNRGKMYYFDPGALTLKQGDKVVVETAKGLEMGDVIKGNHTVSPKQVMQPLRPVVRLATDADLKTEEDCRRREREAFVIGKEKIEAHGLEMKLVDVECSMDGSKILFFFSSEGRVDFRELVKDLAGVFRTRIELRQIGVRDEARMLGGLGICGRAFCCGTFMEEFAPVSTKMAKIQSMSLNPAKISGCCGRLMCCLRYEHFAYEELVKNVPKNGAFVETPDGYGNVTQVNVLRQVVKVRLDGPGEDSIRTYDADEVAAIPGGRPRDGSPPPHVLVLKPKAPKEPEPAEESWVMPERLITTDEERRAKTQRLEPGKKPQSRSRPRKEGQPSQKAKGQRTPKGEQTGERREGEKARSRSRTNQPPRQSSAPKAQEGGEQKPKKSRPHRRYGKRRPGNGDGAPQQGGQSHDK